jgi:hypothetical protein
MKCLLVCGGLLAAFAGSARAQTMLDQEERLIEIHSLLVGLPPAGAPGAYRPGEVGLAVEVIGIPLINGQTGGKVQFTASDHTRVFPRARLAIGLPAPEGYRAFAGLAYIPPITFRDVSSHLGALEAGIAWVPQGPITAGVRGHVLAARSKSPVTERDTRDTLDNFEYGADVSAGYRLDLGLASITPFAGVGVTRVSGDFTVTSDNYVLTSRTTNVGFTGGLQLFAGRNVEAVAEMVVFPGRLVHPSFRLGWVFDPFQKR